MVGSKTTAICNSTTTTATTHKCTGISKMRRGSRGKSENKDGIKLAAATKRKKHGNIIKADNEGTIIKKKQATTAHHHQSSRLNRKRPVARENSTDATIDYLESMVQELTRLLTVVRYILFIYHAQQHTLPK